MKDIKEYFESLKVCLIPVVVGLVILALLLKIVKPKINEIFVLRSDINLAREKLSRLTEKEATLTSFDQEVLEKQFLVANEALPSDQDVPGFLAQMERLAQESGVLIENVSLIGGKLATPSAEKESKVLGETSEKIPSEKGEAEFKGKVILKGVLADIFKFLSKMDGSRRVVNPEKIYLTVPPSDKATPSAVTAQLTLRVYWHPLPATLGKVDEPLPKLSQKDKEVLEKIENLAFLSKPLPISPRFGVEATPSARLSPFGI